MRVNQAPRTRWGIMGTGGIAATFARDLEHVPGASAVAVGSRAKESADRFAAEHGIERAHGSYADLVADPGIDVVYIATPQSRHAADMRMAVEAGVPVLCEKPFTMTAAEAREVVALARARGVFVMEAMWTRYLPHMQRVAALLGGGALGTVTTVIADHGQNIPAGDGHRLHRPDLGGGALLDLGVYPVSFALDVLGRPDSVAALTASYPNGLDAQTSVLLGYDRGAHAVLTTTLLGRTPTRASITGSAGRIELGPRWYAPTSFALIRDGADEPEVFEEPRVGKGLWHQAAAVGELLRAGATESPIMSLDDTIAVMEVMDRVREQATSSMISTTRPASG